MGWNPQTHTQTTDWSWIERARQFGAAVRERDVAINHWTSAQLYRDADFEASPFFPVAYEDAHYWKGWIWWVRRWIEQCCHQFVRSVEPWTDEYGVKQIYKLYSWETLKADAGLTAAAAATAGTWNAQTTYTVGDIVAHDVGGYLPAGDNGWASKRHGNLGHQPGAEGGGEWWRFVALNRTGWTRKFTANNLPEGPGRPLIVAHGEGGAWNGGVGEAWYDPSHAPGDDTPSRYPRQEAFDYLGPWIFNEMIACLNLMIAIPFNHKWIAGRWSGEPAAPVGTGDSYAAAQADAIAGWHAFQDDPGNSPQATTASDFVLQWPSGEDWTIYGARWDALGRSTDPDVDIMIKYIGDDRARELRRKVDWWGRTTDFVIDPDRWQFHGNGEFAANEAWDCWLADDELSVELADPDDWGGWVTSSERCGDGPDNDPDDPPECPAFHDPGPSVPDDEGDSFYAGFALDHWVMIHWFDFAGGFEYF